MSFLYLILGIVLVLWGADKLTDGATGLARRFQVNDLVIGLTVVAFGTSLPEFVTSLFAALKGSSAISLGNVVGSNIFNTLVIVGLTALTRPIWVSRSTLTKDIPFALMSSLVFAVLCWDIWLDDAQFNEISRGDGLILLFFFVIFMYYTFSMARNKIDGTGASESVVPVMMPFWKIGIYIVLGLLGLVFGGNLFVSGASDIAISLGVSESVVGLTLVAGGTSLPELATSIVAARKGNSAIAIGNVIGSNIFNVFFVLGVCAVISPMNAVSVSLTDVLILIFSMLLMWGFASTSRTISRWEGAVMTLLYVLYLTRLIVSI